MPTRPLLLSEKEEQEIVRFMAHESVHICLHLRAPDSVVGAASAFLQRYYLNESVHNIDPYVIMFTCILLACKCEEFNAPVEKIVSFSTDPTAMLRRVIQHEMVVADTLQYNLVVHSLFRPARGFLADMHVRYPSLLQAEPDKAYHDVAPLLRRWSACAVVFLYPPSQVGCDHGVLFLFLSLLLL